MSELTAAALAQLRKLDRIRDHCCRPSPADPCRSGELAAFAAFADSDGLDSSSTAMRSPRMRRMSSANTSMPAACGARSEAERIPTANT
jgi:hypothetical protein